MKQALLLSFGLAALVAIASALTADENQSSCCKNKAQSTVSTTSDDGAACPAGGKCCGHAQQTTVALAADDAPKDKEKSKVQAKCPVSGEKISKDAAVDYKGGKLYFCCEGCAAKFNKDKAKYETKANVQLVATGQAKQKACPLSGGKMNESTKIEVDGIPVAFCCAGCQGKVKEAEADKQREMIFGSKGFEKAFALKKEKPETSKN